MNDAGGKPFQVIEIGKVVDTFESTVERKEMIIHLKKFNSGRQKKKTRPRNSLNSD